MRRRRDRLRRIGRLQIPAHEVAQLARQDLVVVELEVDVVVEADPVVRVAWTVVGAWRHVGDVVHHVHLNVPRIGCRIQQVLPLRGPVLERLDQDVLGKRFGLAEIRTVPVEHVRVGFGRVLDVLRKHGFEVELIVQKRRGVDHDRAGLVVGGHDRSKRDDRAGKVPFDRALRRGRMRRDEVRGGPNDRDLVSRALEAHEFARQMVGVARDDELAAGARRRDDRLNEIPVELVRGELEIKLSVLVPQGKQSVLGRCALDEAVVRSQGVGSHAARRHAAQRQRERNEKKLSCEHILSHWRQGVPLPPGKSALGPAQLRPTGRGSFMNDE